MRIFCDVNVFGESSFAHTVQQKSAFAVERTAADGLHKTAQKAGGQGGLKQHRALRGRNFAAFQAGQRTLGGVAPDGLRAGQLAGVPHRAVPGVALHVAAFAGNRRHRHAVPRAGITAAKTAGVGAEKMALLRRHAGAFAVGDQPAGAQGGGFAFESQQGSLFRIDSPGVKQVELGVLASDISGVRQARGFVGSRETGDVESSLHGLLNGRFGEIAGGSVAAFLAHIHRHTQRFVAVAFHIFELTLAHTHAQAAAFRGFGRRIAGADVGGVFQGRVDQIFKEVAVVAEARLGLAHLVGVTRGALQCLGGHGSL